MGLNKTKLLFTLFWLKNKPRTLFVPCGWRFPLQLFYARRLHAHDLNEARHAGKRPFDSWIH